MEKNNKISESHQWIRDLKASKKLSNKVLGDKISYSDTGMAKALKKETLSLEQIKVIARDYDLLQDLNSHLTNNSENLEDVFLKKGNVGVYLNNNHDTLMKSDDTYKLFIEKLLAYEALKLAKDFFSKS